jgi:hypothetical protein
MAEKEKHIVILASPEGVALALAQLIERNEDSRTPRDRDFWFALYRERTEVVYRARQESMPEDK